MRKTLSSLLVRAAKKDPNVIILSGDHGYQLFDALRRECPNQFVNCGVAEQGMVGLAAGLCRQGFKPIVYGLAAFVPVRTLEQIKLDVCFSNLPVIFLGDGAGLVYSTLGASHQCAEDIAVLRPMPNISVYSPCDASELEDCFNEALTNRGPSYLRIGKDDRPACAGSAGGSTGFWWANVGGSGSKTCIVAHGSMVAPAVSAAHQNGLDCFSVPKIKPIGQDLINRVASYETVIVVEEHSQHGGLFSTLAEECVKRYGAPQIIPLTLKDQFADKCGSYQYALSEHDLSDDRVLIRINKIAQQYKGM